MPIVKTPKPLCELVGQDGNAFAIMGRVSASLRKSGLYTKDEISQITAEMMSGDYDNLLATACKYVEDSSKEMEDEYDDEYDDEDDEEEDY